MPHNYFLMPHVELTAGTVTYRVIDNEVEVLLVKPAIGNAGWMIPKGHVMINDGEPVQDAAKRETQEETGIKVNLLDYLGSVKYEIPAGLKVVHGYLAEPVNPNQKIISDGENSQVKWMPVSSLYGINKEQAQLIAKGIVLAQQIVKKRQSAEKKIAS